MPRSLLPTVLAAVVTAAGLPVLTGAAPATAARAPQDPLAVTIESMTPSVVPRRGRLTLSGVVTNTSDRTWTDLQVYLLASTAPLTTRAELLGAAHSDPATEVAPRLAGPGLFEEIGDLEPGEAARYTVSVRRDDLGISGEPGVYWTGVHVLGADDAGRDGFADGRARTFVPLMGRRARTADLALVVPLRDRVRRTPDGRLVGVRRWQRLLSDSGRLGRLLRFAAESDRPLSWVVDPAVLDAARSVAAGNPPLATGDDGSRAGSTDGADEDEDEDGASPGSSPSADPSATPSSEPDTDEEPTPEAVAASEWLTAFLSAASGATVLALPYGDLDVAAVGSSRLPGLLRQAQRLGQDTAAALDLTTDPVVAPPDGLLPPRALGAVDPEVPVLLDDTAFPGVAGPLVTRRDGTEIVLLDTAAASGGPPPGPRTSPLALRQRLLAEAAVRSLEGGADGPLVVALPPTYDPGATWPSADFFDGLDVPWLRQVDLARVLAADQGAEVTAPPVYPPEARRRQVPFRNLLGSAGLVNTGEVYAHLLTRNDTVADELAEAAMLGSSYSAREHPGQALRRLRQTTERVRRTMALVDVDGPPFVMMSSETGPVAVTVVNNLDEAVTVRLEARAARGGLEVTDPEPLTLEPGQRAPVRMRAESSSIGVHQVTLVATTLEGEPIGSQVQFTVRTSNVGFVIWLVMAAGGGVLLLMIAVRIVRRVRGRRTPEPAP